MGIFQENTHNFEKESDWLSAYKSNISSQCGEDGIIEKIFGIIKDNDKWCVDIGAGNGKDGSNVWNLITQKNWQGVLMEAEKSNFEILLGTYKGINKAICFNKKVTFEGKNTIDNILSGTSIPRCFDLLSIDIDGNDYHIWESMVAYEPKVVVIEFNPSIPMDIEFIQPRDLTINQGSSLLSLVKLGKKKGYELISTTTVNAFFVKKSYFELFGIKDNSLPMIHKDLNFQTRIFQLYDGTLVLSGCKTLIWHQIEIDREKIQILPKFMRKCLPRNRYYILFFLLQGKWKKAFGYIYRAVMHRLKRI